MSEHSEGASEQPPIEKPKSVWQGWAVRQIKEQLEKRRAKYEHESADERAIRRTASATTWIALFTAVTAGIGISHYFAFHGQLDAMRGQLAEMQSTSKQADRTIAAFERLADAAKQTSDFTQAVAQTNAETARRQLRAYLIIEVGSILEVATKKPIIELKVRNAGLTPAHQVIFKGLAAPIEYPPRGGRLPLSFGTKRTAMESSLELNASFLGPNQTTPYYATTNFELTQREIEQIGASQNLRLMAAFVVYYKDAFDVPHYSRLCVILQAVDNTGKVGEYCAQHNDAD